MKEQPTFLGLLKETTDLTRDTRPSQRSSLRPNLNELVRCKLMSTIPKELVDTGLKPLEAIFLSVVATDNDLCTDTLRIFSNFWSDTCEDSIRLQIFLSHSIYSGELNKYLNIDERERLKIKDERKIEVLRLLVPKGYELKTPANIG